MNNLIITINLDKGINNIDKRIINLDKGVINLDKDQDKNLPKTGIIKLNFP